MESYRKNVNTFGCYFSYLCYGCVFGQIGCVLEAGWDAEMQTRTWLQLLSCALVAHNVLIWKLSWTERREGSQSWYSDWSYRQTQVGIYTKTVFHVEQVQKDDNEEHKVEYHKGIWVGMSNDQTCGVIWRTKVYQVTNCNGIVFWSIMKCLSPSKEVQTFCEPQDVFQ